MKSCFIVLIFLLGLSNVSQASNAYLLELQQQAQHLKLADQSLWKRLLHYQSDLSHFKNQSLITNASFFFHPQGHQNPKAELLATLAQFFITTGKDKHSAQCRFPARFQWLVSQLAIDKKQLPHRHCHDLNQWLKDLAVENITLVFPVAYINNPASMFGHSFLKLDRQSKVKGNQLLAWTINYAAKTDHERGLKFVVKGLFGGYQGQFSLAPYYVLLKEYLDLDNRDLWEYQLNFTPQETQRLLRHLWEILPVGFDYYFINKNCAYQLLSLLEVARPQLNLTTQFIIDAIPADTVQALIQHQGLLKKVHYRPALSTKISAKAALLTAPQQNTAKALALGEIPLNHVDIKHQAPLKKAQILELAFDYLTYLNAKKIKYNQKIDGNLAYQLLAARSQLPLKTPEITIARPQKRPDEGHAGNRAHISTGYDGKSAFMEIAHRWAYHDLYDNADGFVKGAEVEFIKSALRYYPTKNQLKLEQLELINLTSLSNYHSFMKPFSWQVALGLQSIRFENQQRHLVGRLKIGGGISYYPSSNTLLSINILSSIFLSPKFRQFTAIGMGADLRLHYDPIPAWRIAFNANVLHYLQGRHTISYHYQLKQRLRLSKNQALTLDLNRKKEFSTPDFSAQLAWQFYF